MFLSNDPKTDCCIGCWFSPGCVLQFQDKYFRDQILTGKEKKI